MYRQAPSFAYHDLGIVEDGDTASQAIEKDKFVIWKGESYFASTDILQGATLEEDVNLTAIPDGVINGVVSALNNNLSPTILTTNDLIGDAMNFTVKSSHSWVVGKILFLNLVLYRASVTVGTSYYIKLKPEYAPYGQQVNTVCFQSPTEWGAQNSVAYMFMAGSIATANIGRIEIMPNNTNQFFKIMIAYPIA